MASEQCDDGEVPKAEVQQGNAIKTQWSTTKESKSKTNPASLILSLPIGRWKWKKMLQLVLESKLKYAQLLTSILKASNDHAENTPREATSFLCSTFSHHIFCRGIHYNGRANCGVFLFVARCTEACFCFTFIVLLSWCCLSLKWYWRSWPVSWSNVVGLCSALIKPCPQSPKGPTLPTSWRSPTLLGVTWVIGRAHPHHQMWRLLWVCGWRNRAAERVVFLTVTVLGAFRFPKPPRCSLHFDSYWFSTCVSMMQDLCFEASATSKPPPCFSTSMAMIDECLTHGFVSVGAPLQICLCPSHVNFPDRIRAILKKKNHRNKSQ